jgi:hypothetical protein
MHESPHEPQRNPEKSSRGDEGIREVCQKIVNRMKTTPSGILATFATHRKEKLVLFPKSKLGNFNECVIRNIVDYIYITDKQKLTPIKIHAKLLQEDYQL